jgi:nitroreductase
VSEAEATEPVARAAIAAILGRQSAAALVGPPPSREELAVVLQAAATVPDHSRLRPWRFLVIEGKGQQRLAEALYSASQRMNPTADEAVHKKAAEKAFFGPLQVALISRPVDSPKVPAWEQQASAAAAGYAIALAAHLLGLGATWKSPTDRSAPELRQALQLEDGELLLGWINIGRLTAVGLKRRHRAPADLTGYVTTLDEDGCRVPMWPLREP